jgi:hypothetical protein
MRFLMILVAAATFAITAPMAQAKGDCASSLGGDLRALLRGAATTAELIGNDDKANTDVYKLLARAAPFGGEMAKLSLTSSAIAWLNCAALEGGGDEYAPLYRAELADLMGIKPTKLTADRVQKWLGNRLENGTPGQFHLLSEAEQAVFSNIFCHVGLEIDATLTDPLIELLADARLPGCWGPTE